MPKADTTKKHRVNTESESRKISNANLLRVPKGGKSPNPKGRGKGILNFKTRVEMAINRLASEYVVQHNKKKENKKNQITVDDVDIMGDIFSQYLNKSRNGNDRVLIHFIEMVYDKPKQKSEITGENGNPIEINARIEEKKAKARAMLDRWTKPPKQEKDNGNSRSKK